MSKVYKVHKAKQKVREANLHISVVLLYGHYGLYRLMFTVI